MRRFLLCLLGLVWVVAGCASPIQSLPGRVVDAEIVIDPDKLRLIDWVSAGRIAASDGIAYKPIPQSSPKPTQQEIAEANAILESNRAYTQYVQRPEVLRRAEAQALPGLERWLTALPGEGFQTNRYRYPPVNASGTALKLVLYPDAALVSPKTFAERTSAQAAGDLAVRGATALLLGGASAGRETLRYVGDFQLVSATTGNPIRSGRLNTRFRYDRGLNQSIPHAKLFSMMIWDAILRNATSGPAKQRTPTQPSATSRTVSPERKQTAAATTTPQVAPPEALAQPAPPVPGSPPLFEGTSYALFSPEHIQAYCQQNWRTRTSPDGRTEYNPCFEKSYFTR